MHETNPNLRKKIVEPGVVNKAGFGITVYVICNGGKNWNIWPKKAKSNIPSCQWALNVELTCI